MTVLTVFAFAIAGALGLGLAAVITYMTLVVIGVIFY
jgi:hypothetical protein